MARHVVSDSYLGRGRCSELRTLNLVNDVLDRLKDLVLGEVDGGTPNTGWEVEYNWRMRQHGNGPKQCASCR